MPRKHHVDRRNALPDPKHGNVVVGKFINCLMRNGKKSVAENIMYGALDFVAQRSKEDPVKVFEQALDNVRPVTEVKSARVGGSTYQVPIEIRGTRRQALAMRWLIGYAKARAGKDMSEKLGGELLDAANNRGAAVKKREDTHKMAEANKAFSHYRW